MATWNYDNENNHLLLCSNKNYMSLCEGDLVKIYNNKYAILYDTNENAFRFVGIECKDIELDTENLDDISDKLGNIFDNPELLPIGVHYLNALFESYDVLGENREGILEAIAEYLTEEDDCENCDGDCDTCEIGNRDSEDNDEIITDKIIDAIADIFKKLLN